MSSRNTCFTLNNYTEEEYKSITNWDCKYLIVGKEVGEQGTPHLQGYVEWNGSKRLSTLKKINGRIHWENRKGTAKQAADYCKKENNFFEKGELSIQGKRTDLQIVGEKVINKIPIREIAQEHPDVFIKYHKGIQRLKEVLYTDRTECPEVHWRWGASGTGKTRFCIERHPNHYIKDGTIWWDGYEQQEAIIIDDFDGRWNYRDLLRLLDRYKYQGQTKGGYIKINSPFIYITCEYPPEHFWSENELDQVTRRLNSISQIVADVAEVGR